jgi:hypothetical protein
MSALCLSRVRSSEVLDDIWSPGIEDDCDSDRYQRGDPKLPDRSFSRDRKPLVDCSKREYPIDRGGHG